ncbi:MAG: polysaccharide deacetylase [Bacilli bacterium]|nr:polysaccharide deacetylase [Bacilli bacterium]
MKSFAFPGGKKQTVLLICSVLLGIVIASFSMWALARGVSDKNIAFASAQNYPHSRSQLMEGVHNKDAANYFSDPVHTDQMMIYDHLDQAKKIKSNQQIQIPILVYHSIADNPSNPYCTNPSVFDAEMRHLKDTGYTTITFGDLESAWLQGSKLPQRPIIVSLDDGYADNYTNAFPVLQKYNQKATIFMVTGFAAQTINQMNHLDWDQLREMQNSGVIDIQSHSVHHLDMTQLSDEQLKHEVVDSKAELEKKLGKPVTIFCYPFGAYNDKVKKMLKDSGYLFAATTNEGAAAIGQGDLALDRYHVNGVVTPAMFAARFP